MARLARYMLFALLSLVLFACGVHLVNSGDDPLPPRPAGVLRVASHNVHYILLQETDGPWSVGDWNSRKHALTGAIRAIDADIVAFQEMESFARGSDGSVNLARDHLLSEMPGHAAAASGDWRRFPSTQPIFYRTERLTLLDQGWFFFSDTPDVIYSRTFNGSYPAFASWARFRDRPTGHAFRVVNVHFEFSSASNRRLSAELVRARIAPWIDGGETVILLGDINALAGSRPAGILEAAGLAFAPVRGTTYHFDRGLNLFGAIDHIAATSGVSMGPPHVLRRKFAGRWPSDHYPVIVDLALPAEARAAPRPDPAMSR